MVRITSVGVSKSSNGRGGFISNLAVGFLILFADTEITLAHSFILDKTNPLVSKTRKSPLFTSLALHSVVLCSFEKPSTVHTLCFSTFLPEGFLFLSVFSFLEREDQKTRRMGRKRKAAVADEVKTSKSYLETTSPDKRSPPNAEISSAVELNSNSSPEEKKTPTVFTTNSVLRRSGRLRSPVYPSRRQQAETVVEHVILDENEKEEVPDSEKLIDPLPAVDEKNSEVEMQVGQVSSPPADNGEGSLLEKDNNLVWAVDEFKPKNVEQVIGRPNEVSPSDSRYKSLYLKSQKKNEALMEENYELVRNLEFVRGQLAAYEKMMETMGALKEVRFVSGLGKFTDANASLPPETVKNCVPSPSAAGAAVPDTAGEDDDNNPKQTRKSSKKKKARN